MVVLWSSLLKKNKNIKQTISFKEYLQYHLGIVFSTEELFDIVFAMYDADRDGYITRDELEDVVTNSTRWMGDCDVESKEVQELVRTEVEKVFNIISVISSERVNHKKNNNKKKKKKNRLSAS